MSGEDRMLLKIINKYKLNALKVESIEKGFTSKKWLIQTDTGKAYVLKEIDNQPVSRMNFILSVQSQLKSIAPQILLSENKKLYVKNQNKYYYIAEFIDGETDVITSESLVNIGIFMGKLHKMLFSVKTKEKSDFLKVPDNENKIKNHIRKVENQEIKNILLNKLKIIEKIQSETRDLEQRLQHQIIHGDFYCDNLISTTEGLKIIDFDQTCYFYKEYELLRGAFMLVYSSNKTVEKIISDLKLFFRGYSKTNYILSSQSTYHFYLKVQANDLAGLGLEKSSKLDMNFAIKRNNMLLFLFQHKNKIIEALQECEHPKMEMFFEVKGGKIKYEE